MSVKHRKYIVSIDEIKYKKKKIKSHILASCNKIKKEIKGHEKTILTICAWCKSGIYFAARLPYMFRTWL